MAVAVRTLSPARSALLHRFRVKAVFPRHDRVGVAHAAVHFRRYGLVGVACDVRVAIGAAEHTVNRCLELRRIGVNARSLSVAEILCQSRIAMAREALLV